MKPVATFHVRPSIPERLHALEDLALNVRWAWDHETIGLFRRLDRELWETSGHNPALMLGLLPQRRLNQAAADEAFLAHLDRTAARLDAYRDDAATWYRRTFEARSTPLVAYFSMEFGITECLPNYSGGLGILAGDHLKSASDLGVPLVGVGLLYQKGYFRQYLNAEGWQQELYPVNDFSNLPIRPCRGTDGRAVHITVELDGRTVHARLWRVDVGRVPLVLLDTNIAENEGELQDLTDELYGGDQTVRMRQEMLLGIGGVRALERLGLLPDLYHLNEGHCAFLSLERIRRLMKDRKLSFAEAREVVSATTVFTTHTPVPAGIDTFPPGLVRQHFRAFCEELGISEDALLALGRPPGSGPADAFNMAILALHTSCSANGVSRLHGRVARAMWRSVWPGLPEEEVPIGSVTNGVHAGSWISEEMRTLYDRYLGPRWIEEPSDGDTWRTGAEIPGEELWRTHERRRERLVAFARRRLAEQLRKRGAGKAAIDEARAVLDPDALTLGFARRFATYKRATLLLRDPERLARILGAAGRPVQIIFAGKAHPRDEEGKAIIRSIVQRAALPEFRRRLVFLEDYDAVVARYLVQGADVWVNTPRRPLEASGTSGMKAAFNGALNLSVLDGWWDEAYAPETGWAIGRGEEFRDHDYQDRVESGALYDLLEREVVPLFYDRGADGLPRGWIDLMRSAVTRLCPVYNTNRMVREYVVNAYHPALEQGRRILGEDCRGAREVAAWRRRVAEGWSQVAIDGVEVDSGGELRVGDAFEIRVRVRPGPLTANDLEVQAYLGSMDDHLEIRDGEAIPLDPAGPPDGGTILYRGRIPCQRSGAQGITARVLPRHDDLPVITCGVRVTWAG